MRVVLSASLAPRDQPTLPVHSTQPDRWGHGAAGTQPAAGVPAQPRAPSGPGRPLPLLPTSFSCFRLTGC